VIARILKIMVIMVNQDNPGSGAFKKGIQ